MHKIFSYKTIAVVGMSPKKDRPSNKVGAYLHSKRYNVIAVNPTVENIGSIPSYASLKDIPDKIDIVNVFRKKEFVKSITNDAIKIDAKVLWLQEGIVDNDAAVLASSHGMAVVMDLCMLKEHKKI
jgi:predicted CoA-binding protein